MMLRDLDASLSNALKVLLRRTVDARAVDHVHHQAASHAEWCLLVVEAIQLVRSRLSNELPLSASVDLASVKHEPVSSQTVRKIFLSQKRHDGAVR